MSTWPVSLGYSCRGVVLTTHPSLSPGLKKEWSYICALTLDLHDLLQGKLYERKESQGENLRASSSNRTHVSFSLKFKHFKQCPVGTLQNFPGEVKNVSGRDIYGIGVLAVRGRPL
jgi:hypothetical protein